MRIAIIGAGAAGCFAAINIKRVNPASSVHVFESKHHALAKVAITGGGRCNLTNTFRDIKNMRDAYPRGDKLMRKVFKVFDHKDTMQWFEDAGVELVTQTDQCVFPQSQDAMEIVGCLLTQMRQLGVKLHTDASVSAVSQRAEGLQLTLADGQASTWDRVVVTTGGHPTPSGFKMLSPLQIPIESPVPSLFTFCMAGHDHAELMGTVVENVALSIPSTKFRSQGPLLFTHWGVSGPAVLKLSSYAARHLAEHNYKCQLCINWFGHRKESEVRQIIDDIAHSQSRKFVTSYYPHHLTQRHWLTILRRANVAETQRWGTLNAKETNRLLAVLTSDIHQIAGRGTYKDEFVTCGGVSLKDIDPATLQSRTIPGLYFAGEVLDVDAITGGFNLQAAWSTAYVVAMQMG